MIKKEEVRHGVSARVLGKSRGKSLDDSVPKLSLGDILLIVKTYGDPWIGNDGYIVAQNHGKGINDAYFFGPEDLESVQGIE